MFSRAAANPSAIAAEAACKSNPGHADLVCGGGQKHLRKRLSDAFPRAHYRALPCNPRVGLGLDENGEIVVALLVDSFRVFDTTRLGGRKVENVGGRGRQILKEQAWVLSLARSLPWKGASPD